MLPLEHSLLLTPPEMPHHPPPSSCPNCGKSHPNLVSCFPGSLGAHAKEKSTLHVYKCQCGYLFAVEGDTPPVDAEKKSVIRSPATPNEFGSR
jgi:hypothetical protein